MSEFRFDRWYDQEGFMLGLQANFQPTADLNLILKVSGNIEKKNNAAYSDDGVSQVVTMQTGVALSLIHIWFAVCQNRRKFRRNIQIIHTKYTRSDFNFIYF